MKLFLFHNHIKIKKKNMIMTEKLCTYLRNDRKKKKCKEIFEKGISELIIRNSFDPAINAELYQNQPSSFL
jgi:hypothetical protein